MMRKLLFVGLVLFVATLGAQVQHGLNWTMNPVTTDLNGNPANVTGYNMYCSTSAQGPFTTKSNTSLLPTPSFLETGLTEGTTYFCQYTAVNAVGEGAHSPTGSALFQLPPAAPGAPLQAPGAIPQ